MYIINSTIETIAAKIAYRAGNEAKVTFAASESELKNIEMFLFDQGFKEVRIYPVSKPNNLYIAHVLV